jgi:hypothetical protein
VIGHALHFLVADEGAVDALDRVGVGLVEHVALAQQLFGALLAQDGAAVDAAGHGKGNARGQVGLDHAGDDVHRRALRRHDQVDARRAALLRKPLDQDFDFLAHRHHQVGQLVDDHHDLRQHLVFELLFLEQFLAGLGIEADLDAAAQRLALACAARTFSLKPERLRTPIDDIWR